MKVAVTLLLASVAAQVYVTSGWDKNPHAKKEERKRPSWGSLPHHGHHGGFGGSDGVIGGHGHGHGGGGRIGGDGVSGRGRGGHGADIANWGKKLENFKVQIPGFLMPGLRIPGFMAEGWFPDFGEIDGVEGFLVAHKQFKPASSFASFRVRFGQPGFQVNNRFVPIRNLRNVFEFYVYNRIHDRLQINGLPPLRIDYKDGIPPFYVQNIEIPGFAPDGLFPSFRFSTRADAGFEVDGRFKNVKEFPGVKIVSFRPRLTMNGQKVGYEDLKLKLDNYFRTGGTVEKLKLEGFTVQKRKIKASVPGFTIKGLNIPGFAINGRFPSIKYEGRVPGFVISGQFVPGTEFEAFKIENGVPGLVVNGKWYPYDANLEKYLKSLGPKFEKLEIPGFTLEIEGGPPTPAPPVTAPPPPPVVTGHLGFATVNGVPGFVIKGKGFVPGWKVPGFQIRGDQNGFIIDGVFWSIDKLKNEKPTFRFDETLRIPEITFPSYTHRGIPGGGTLTGVTFKGYFVPSEKIKGFTVQNNMPGITIKGKFVPISQIQVEHPGIKIETTDPERLPELIFPGVVTEGGKEYLKIGERKIPLDLVPNYEKAPDGIPSIKIDDEYVPIFQLPIRFPKFQLTIPAAEWPEIKFPGFKVKGGVPGFVIKGEWIPGTDIRGFQLRGGFPGFIIEGKFHPLDQVPGGFKLPQVLPRFTYRDGVPGLIVEGKFVPGTKIPDFKVEFGVPGFTISGTFHPLNNLPEKFVLDIKVPSEKQVPVFEIRGGVPGLIVEGKWTPATQFPGFTIRFNRPGFVLKGKWVPLDKVNPDEVPAPEEKKEEPKEVPIYVMKGTIPGIIFKGGFIPGDKLPGFTVQGNVPGITIEGKFTPLKDVPKDFKWPDPTPQPSLTIVVQGNVPGIIFHGKFLPTSQVPGFEIKTGVPGITLSGKFHPLTDLTEDNVPKKVEGIIRYIVKDGAPGIEVNGKFTPSEQVPGFTVVAGVPGLTVKGTFYPLEDILADKAPPEVTITIQVEPPKKKFPQFITKGGVPGLLIDGEFVDGDFIKDFYLVPIDGTEEPVFHIDGKFVPLKEVPVKYPNFQVTVLKTSKKDLLPRFETRDDFPGLVINGEFIPGKYITDFVVENNVPGFKPGGGKFIPLQLLPVEKPGYMIEVNIPKPTVVPEPTVYNGVFGFIVDNTFYPATRIPGVKVTGKWPEIEVPVVIPGYPGEKPKFTIKDWTPGFIVKGDKFVPLREVPGVLFVGPDLVIPGPKTQIIPIFVTESKLPTIEFTFGIPGIDLQVSNGEKVTKPPTDVEETTTTEKPKPPVPEFVINEGVPGLIIEGTFYPGTSIRDFKVEGTVPGFVVKDKFVPLIELPEKVPGYIIKIRDPNFPKYKVLNGKPGLVLFGKFVPYDWVKGMKIKDDQPYFPVKGKDTPLGDLPDNYRFQIETPPGFKIEPTIAYGEIGFLVNELFYPASKTPGLKVQGEWPKVEVPGVKVPGHENDKPVFTIVNFVPGFLFPDKSFVPAFQVPGVEFDGLSITIPGARIPTIQFPGFEFTLGIPGGTLEFPPEYIKPKPIVTTTQRTVNPDTPDGYPLFIVKPPGVPGLIINNKFVPGDRIHRFTVKDGKPGFTYDGTWIHYKEIPQKRKDFTITILPENWPTYEVKDGVPGLVMNKRFIPGKYFQDFEVKSNVPGFTIKGTFVPLDDLIEKEPDYEIQFKVIEEEIKPTIYDGEIGFIVDKIFYPGSRIPGLSVKGEWPKVPVPGLKIPGYENETPVFTIVDWVPGFLIPGQPNLPLIPAKKVPGVQFDGVTIILPGAQIPTIQFPGFEFTLGLPGVQVDVPNAVPVSEFTTQKPTTTTLDPNAPYTAPPGFFPYVVLNGEPGLYINGHFYPARKIRHFRVIGKIPGFDVDGTWVPYHDLPTKAKDFKITVIPEGYPEYLVKNKQPGLVFGGKWWPAPWVKDFVPPHNEEEEPGFMVNGFFVPLLDLFDKAPGYKIVINPPPIEPKVTIINGEIGFLVENKFYPGSKIPGLQISGTWPKVEVPGFVVPGHEKETPVFTIKDFVPGFIVKPDKFIPAKDVPGVKIHGITIELEGARIPTIQFPGFEFSLGIPGITVDVDPQYVVEVKPTEPPQQNAPEFVIIDKVPGLRIDGKFYPAPLIQDFTINVNEPGFIINGDFVPLKDVRYKYPDYTIKIMPPVNPLVIRPEFYIHNAVIGVVVDRVFYPGNKIPGIQTTHDWPEVAIPGLKIKGHEDETPVLTVKDFTIGFTVRKPEPKFIPATEVPQVHIDGTTITIEGVSIPTIQFPGFSFTLGIPGIDIKLPVGIPISRPTNPPVSKDKLPEYKVVGTVPGLVIHDKFIPGVFIKDFTVIGDVPGFLIKDKHVPLKDLPKEAPDYVITINLQIHPVLTYKNGIIGFEINNQFIPGNQVPGVTIEGVWPEIPAVGVEIPGHEKDTPIFTVRDWVPGFVIKGEFIPADKLPGFNVINNVIVIPGYVGIIKFPSIDIGGIIDILEPHTTPAPMTSVTPSTHFLGFNIVNGIPVFTINGKEIPAAKIPNFVVRKDVPGFIIRGKFIPLVDIEIKFPGFQIIVNGDEFQIHVPEITEPPGTEPTFIPIIPLGSTQEPSEPETTARPVPTTISAVTKADQTVNWDEFGRIIYNIAYKWERIRETFSDTCQMEKPVTIETVINKKVIGSNALNKIRFFNEPFGHYLEVLFNDYIPKLAKELDLCGTCGKAPLVEFIEKSIRQFCLDLRKQPLIPFLPDAIPPVLRTAIRKFDVPTDAEVGAVNKVRREAALRAKSDAFWSARK